MAKTQGGCRGQLVTQAEVRQFVLGGRAKLTIEDSVVQDERGKHVTVKINTKAGCEKDERAPLFVRIFTGRDHEAWNDYTYAGVIFREDRRGNLKSRLTLVTGRKGGFSDGDSRLAQVQWLLDVVNGDREIYPMTTRIWHEGRCCFCGLPLTQPESVHHGYGPDCAQQRGLPYGRTSTPLRANDPVSTTPSTPLATQPDELRPAELKPIDVACPLGKCGAQPNERCTRNGRRLVGFHKLRRNAAERANKRAARRRAATPTPAPSPPATVQQPTPPAPQPTPSTPAQTVGERASELLAQGWTSGKAALEQARHEAKGFTRWEPAMGLPSAAVVDKDGKVWEATGEITLEEDGDDDEDWIEDETTEEAAAA